MDCDYMETARAVTLMGADLILYPTAYPGIVCPTDSWHSRAFENGVYFLAANQWGEDRGAYFAGGSSIINPDGSIQAWQDINNTIVYGQVDINKVRKHQFPNSEENKILDRRPELYKRVAMNTYLFTPAWFFTQYGYKPLPDGTKSVIAAAQFRPENGSIDKNLKAMEQMIAEKKAQNDDQHIDLIVFPELAVSGVINAEKSATIIPGKITDKLVQMAKKHKTFIVAGMPEKDGDKKYNTSVLVGPTGFVGKYRKTHLNHLDKKWAYPGDKLSTFNTKLGRIAMLIGYDALFPETSRDLAAWATDILCVPSALSYPKPISIEGSRAKFDDSMGPVPTGPNPNHWHYFRTVAGGNNMYCVFANQYGKHNNQNYMGKSGVFPPEMFFFPRPESIASESGNIIITQNADTTYGVSNPDYNYSTNICRSKDWLTWRKPNLYEILVTETTTPVESMVIK